MRNRKFYFVAFICTYTLSAVAQEAAYIFPAAKITIHGGSMSVWGNMSNSANSAQSGSLTINDGAKIVFYGNTWENRNGSDIQGGALSSGEVDFVAPRPAPFAGSFSQNLTGGGEGQSFPSLRVSNGQNVNLLTTATRVRGVLTFAVNDGHIVSNGNNLVIGNGSAFPGAIAGYNPARYFVTNQCGAGHLVRNGFNNSTQIFPIGMAENDYTPIAILPAAGTARVSANVCNYASSVATETLLLSKGINRTWNIFANASGEAQITLQHNSNTNNTGGGGLLTYSDADGFIVQSAVGGTWQGYVAPPNTFSQGNLQDGGGVVPGAALHSRNFTLSRSAASLSANFTKDYSGLVLPVSRLTFTAHLNNSKVVLDWRAVSEYNLAYYEVTRSVDGRAFAALTKQTAANTANAYYSYTDDVASLTADKVYYRLRMTDKDGTSKLSNIALINISKKETVTVYPNPATALVNVSINVEAAEKAEIILYNAAGQVVKRQVAGLLPGSQTVQITGLQMLANGQYELVIKLKDGNLIKQKIVLKH